MSAIDIRECTIKVWDGTPNTITLDSTAAKSDLTLTAKSLHCGSLPPTITLVDPNSNSASLSVTATGRNIVVNLATDGSGDITSTAALVKAAIEALPAAHALVTVTLEDDGSGVVDAHALTALTGANSIEVKIGEGNLTYSDKRPVKFILDRGDLDSVSLDNDEPLELSIDAMWEYLKASSGGSPTLEDACKRRGEAAAWVSTATDPCNPYCIDVEIVNDQSCGNVQGEYILFTEFYYEQVDHDLGDASLSMSGRCNAVEPTITRE